MPLHAFVLFDSQFLCAVLLQCLLVFFLSATSLVALFYCFTVALFYCCSVALLYCCSVYCFTVALFYCCSVLLFYCCSVLLFDCCSVALFYCCSVLLLFCFTVALLLCFTVALFYCCSVLLSCVSDVSHQSLRANPVTIYISLNVCKRVSAPHIGKPNTSVSWSVRMLCQRSFLDYCSLY